MKKLIHFLPVLLAGLLIFSACGEEPTPTPVLPTLALVEGSGFAADGDTIFTGAEFMVQVTATKGDDALNRISVSQNGTVITDLSRIKFDGDAAGGNPSPLPTEDQSGFTWTISIQADTVTDVTNTYTISVTDAGNNVAQLSFDIYEKVEFIPTPLGTFTQYLLKNQAGPAGTGGLDLDTGTGTGSAAPTADIKDQGIDLGAPSNATNWIQKIAGVNGSVLHYPDASFDYETLSSLEELIAAYDAGVEFTVSDKVEIGDLFLVKTNTGYFALKTVDIVVTANDNTDYYEFEVKKVE